MAERRLQRHQQRGPRNMGPAKTTGPVLLMTPQVCTQGPVLKCTQANICPFRAANRPCMSGFSSENFRNWGPTQAPTAPRLKTNMSQTIKEAQEASPTLFQAISLVIFHPDASSFAHSILPRGAKWTDLLAQTDTPPRGPSAH